MKGDECSSAPGGTLREFNINHSGGSWTLKLLKRPGSPRANPETDQGHLMFNFHSIPSDFYSPAHLTPNTHRYPHRYCTLNCITRCHTMRYDVGLGEKKKVLWISNASMPSSSQVWELAENNKQPAELMGGRDVYMWPWSCDRVSLKRRCFLREQLVYRLSHSSRSNSTHVMMLICWAFL